MKMRKNERGFTLIEVLVATVIMAIGLLGIVTMHGNALYFTKDSESQWLASDNVFKVFDTMRVRLKPRINNNIANRPQAALDAMQRYAFAGPGGIANNCPNVIATEIDELQCIQRDLEAALPGGRLERITINPGGVQAGMTVEVSWLAAFQGTDAEAEAECNALAATSGESYADSSVNSGISADFDCSNAASGGDVRKVATWVMVP